MDNAERVTAAKGDKWGIACLIVGVVACALAIIPPAVHGRPLPVPWQVAEPDPEPQRPVKVRVEPKVKFKLGKVTVGFGEKEVVDEVPAQVKEAPPPDPLRWYGGGAAVLALIGMVLTPIAWTKKEHPAFALTALAFCTTALTWQYIAFGIAAGAAVAAFLVVLAMLGSALN